MKLTKALMILLPAVGLATVAGLTLLEEQEPEITVPERRERRPKPGPEAPSPYKIKEGSARPRIPRPAPAPAEKPPPGPAPKVEASDFDGVELTVLGADGQPLRGAQILARTNGRRLGLKRTPETGVVLFDGLRAGEGFIAEVAHFRYSTPRLIGPVENKTRVTLRFPPEQAGEVFGGLRTAEGAPVPGAKLHVDTLGDRGYELDDADLNIAPDGGFRFELAPGSYIIYATAKGFSESTRSRIRVEPAKEHAVYLALQPQGRVFGRVIGNFSNDAKLLFEMIRMSGSEKNPLIQNLVLPIDSDSSGTFALEELDPGRYRLRARVDGRPQEGSAWQQFVLPSGGAKELELELKPLKLTVEGFVIGEDNQPVAGATVRCTTVEAVADEQGRFALYGIPEGFWKFTVATEGYAPFEENIVTDERNSRIIKVQLKQFGRIEGRVVGPSGAAAARSRVVLCWKKSDGSIQVIPGITDAEGRYRFDERLSGEYYVKAGSGDPFNESGAPHFKLEAGKGVTVPDLVAEDAGG